MALALKTKHQSRRTDMYFIDPSDIILEDNMRGRKFPPSDEEVIGLAMSMMKLGQQQPIVCRRDGQTRPVAVSGFTRTTAARMIRKGFTGSDGEKYQDKEFFLQVKIIDQNEKEAAAANIVENHQRSETSVIDDAHNQRNLRERHGYSDDEIASLYGCSKAHIKNIARLTSLDEKTQRMIHDGKIPVSAAMDLIELPSEEQKQVIAESTKSTGKVSGAIVRKQVRDRQLQKNSSDEEENSGSQKSKPRTHKEISDWIQGRLTNEVKEISSGPVNEFMEKFLLWINGKLTDETINKWFKALS